MRPGFSGVAGFVNAVAHGKIGPRQTFAAPDINNVGIGRRHGNGSDRLRRFTVKDGIPRAAVIVRLPDAAVDRAHVKHIGLTRHAASCAGPAAARGADHAPAHFLVSGFGNLLRRGGMAGNQSKHGDKRKRKNAKPANHGGPPEKIQTAQHKTNGNREGAKLQRRQYTVFVARVTRSSLTFPCPN